MEINSLKNIARVKDASRHRSSSGATKGLSRYLVVQQEFMVVYGAATKKFSKHTMLLVPGIFASYLPFLGHFGFYDKMWIDISVPHA